MKVLFLDKSGYEVLKIFIISAIAIAMLFLILYVLRYFSVSIDSFLKRKNEKLIVQSQNLRPMKKLIPALVSLLATIILIVGFSLSYVEYQKNRDYEFAINQLDPNQTYNEMMKTMNDDFFGKNVKIIKDSHLIINIDQCSVITSIDWEVVITYNQINTVYQVSLEEEQILLRSQRNTISDEQCLDFKLYGTHGLYGFTNAIYSLHNLVGNDKPAVIDISFLYTDTIIEWPDRYIILTGGHIYEMDRNFCVDAYMIATISSEYYQKEIEVLFECI